MNYRAKITKTELIDALASQICDAMVEGKLESSAAVLDKVEDVLNTNEANVKGKLGLSIYERAPQLETLRFSWMEGENHHAMETNITLNWNAYAAAIMLRQFANALEEKAKENDRARRKQ